MEKNMRKVGIYYAFWTHEWDVEFAPFVKRVAGLGFDQLELNGGTVAQYSSAKRKDLKSLADDHGITLSYGIGLPKQYDVSSLDSKVREKGLDFMKQMIDAVSSMGGGMIGGTVHSYWPGQMPLDIDSKQPIWDKSVESMKILAPYAYERGVTLNVEVLNRFEQFLINDSKEALAYVKEVNSKGCNIVLDTYHINIEEESFSVAIKTIGQY